MSISNRTQALLNRLLHPPQWEDLSLSRQPFFIVGSGRSGNTLLRVLLMRLKGVYIPPETYVLGDVARGYRWWRYTPWRYVVYQVLATFEYHPNYEYIDISLRDVAADLLSLPREKQSLSRILDTVYRFWAQHDLTAECLVWGDKTPWNAFSMNPISKVFPDSKWIHMLRDGRDAALSYVAAGLQPSLEAAATRWTESVLVIEKFAKENPERVMTVRYEDLVQEPEPVLKAVCSYLNLDYSARMLEQVEQKNLGDANEQPHHAKVHQPLSATSIEKWKQEDPEVIQRLENIMGPTLERLGY